MCYCFYRNFVLLAVQVHDREHAGGERAEPAAPGDHQRIHRREDQAARGGIQPHSHQDRRTQGKMHGQSPIVFLTLEPFADNCGSRQCAYIRWCEEKGRNYFCTVDWFLLVKGSI